MSEAFVWFHNSSQRPRVFGFRLQGSLVFVSHPISGLSFRRLPLA